MTFSFITTAQFLKSRNQYWLLSIFNTIEINTIISSTGLTQVLSAVLMVSFEAKETPGHTLPMVVMSSQSPLNWNRPFACLWPLWPWHFWRVQASYFAERPSLWVTPLLMCSSLPSSSPATPAFSQSPSPASSCHWAHESLKCHIPRLDEGGGTRSMIGAHGGQTSWLCSPLPKC